ncbi:hypothetical protein B6I21_06730 [candidate division KSB1 bacterium 4572_119]|nr:MAG: hypothetical protein B6I21_06730 [candidate division KSB1 bacterium 4572_119]
MANIQDYTSGKILSQAKLALRLLKFVSIPIIGNLIVKKLLEEIKLFEPKLIDIEVASAIIQKSKTCAVGERACKALHKNSKFTETVFLDELADELVGVEKAKYVTKHEAIATLKKYKNPIILSKVGNNSFEICRSTPKECVYWNFERRGLKCLIKEFS